MDVINQDALSIAELIKKREISALDVTRAFLERNDKVEPKVKAYIKVADELALARAREVDMELADGIDAGVFGGVPIAVKDVLTTKGFPTTCGSKMLEGFVPVYDATAVERIQQAGTVMIGKTNMDEFAMGSSTENSYFGPTMNPWDLERVPGGSSGGSAAAVAAGEAPWALGSDTGGSIRQPAALCGIVGLKPTYGLVSRYGLVAFASSLDQIGPLTRDVEDSATLLNTICGWDENDSTSINQAPPDYTKFLVDDMKNVKIGVPRELMVKEMDSEIKDSVDQALKLAQAMGAEIEETSLPSLEYA